MEDNPFERYGLDPREGVSAITKRLKELAEDASTDAERDAIRKAWEELTLHPARRLRAALRAHPETRPELGSPPMLPRVRVTMTELTLRDLAARPSAVAVLPDSLVPQTLRTPAAANDAPPLEQDPLL